ncbi:MAG TPA: hypothetical protein VG408_04120 [Actinomycetota bacterium]|nr:hypothetical protein [Actinomycetota bacterium]
MSPTAGFQGALHQKDRRARKGTRPAEGTAPYILAFLGGAAAMLLWLKVGSLLGAREVAASDFRWSYVVVSCIGAGVLALVAQTLYGWIGRVAVTEAGSSDLRLIWGAAAFPQVITLVMLLPLDLVLVGSDTFTSTRLTDPLETGWAALSIALTFSVAAWSVFLFYRGLTVVSDAAAGRVIAGVVLGVASAALVAAPVIVGLSLLAGS